MPTPGPGRRPPARGKGTAGRGGPRRTPGAGRPSRRTSSTAATSSGPAAARAGASPRRPRFTSRAAVLVVILAVLAVSYASSLRAYLQQRDHLDDLQSRIDASQADIERMEGEIQRQRTPAYIEQQGREQGMVFPGEKPFVVLDDGRPLETDAELSDPATIDPAQPEAWWDDAWATMEVAGHPQRKAGPRPEDKLTDLGTD
ncbi:septum formation initiator family protein [Nocardioides sp. C4-1]|uniref:FtsB family cell division protein n=1 Tax=Nocardioides sp. C4-1 TaxID=3151851 RepID=UPI0032652778